MDFRSFRWDGLWNPHRNKYKMTSEICEDGKVDLTNDKVWKDICKDIRSNLRSQNAKIPNYLDQEIEQRNLL